MLWSGSSMLVGLPFTVHSMGYLLVEIHIVYRRQHRRHSMQYTPHNLQHIVQMLESSCSLE